MLSEPALLLLDEPFASLDHEGGEIIASLMRGAIERGAAVIATAHAIPEIEDVDFAAYEILRGRLQPHVHKEEGRRGGRIRSLLGR
jgi:ABC-type multidrug transport system ATPase subunit